jgi:hypothetical protein
MSDKVAPLRQASPANAATLTAEVAALIVEALNLDIAPADRDGTTAACRRLVLIGFNIGPPSSPHKLFAEAASLAH